MAAGLLSPAELSQLLQSQGSAEELRDALDAVAKSGASGVKYVEPLLKCLAAADCSVRAAAVGVFKGFGPEAAPLVQKLAPLLASQEGSTRCAAAMCLGHIGAPAQSCGPAVAKLLSDDFNDIASAQLWLTGIVKKPEASLRRAKCAGALAVASIGDHSRANEVSALLKDGAAEVVEAALQALGDMGAKGAAFEAAALERIGDVDAGVASAALLAVGKMGEATGGSRKEVVEALAKKLLSPSAAVRVGAAEALLHTGPETAAVLSDLAKCFQEDRCPQVRAAALRAVAASGVPGEVYAPLVAAMLMDESPVVRVAAVGALKLMGRRGLAVADEVAQLGLQDASPEVRLATLSTLGDFVKQPQAEHLLPHLEAMCDDEDEEVRLAAEDRVRSLKH